MTVSAVRLLAGYPHTLPPEAHEALISRCERLDEPIGDLLQRADIPTHLLVRAITCAERQGFFLRRNGLPPMREFVRSCGTGAALELLVEASERADAQLDGHQTPQRKVVASLLGHLSDEQHEYLHTSAGLPATIAIAWVDTTYGHPAELATRLMELRSQGGDDTRLRFTIQHCAQVAFKQARPDQLERMWLLTDAELATTLLSGYGAFPAETANQAAASLTTAARTHLRTLKLKGAAAAALREPRQSPSVPLSQAQASADRRARAQTATRIIDAIPQGAPWDVAAELIAGMDPTTSLSDLTHALTGALR